MKKLLLLLLSAVLMLSLAGCGRVSSSMEITCDTSQIYSQEDICQAIGAVENYFCRNFNGCTLTEIGYIGDEKRMSMEEWAEQYDADQAIVLTSTFETDRRGGDGSLNTNETYRNFKWILIRDRGGEWSHADHGYG